jgi:hypothetical protein
MSPCSACISAPNMLKITPILMKMVMMMEMVTMTIIKIRLTKMWHKTAGIRCMCCKSGSHISLSKTPGQPGIILGFSLD